MISRDGPAYLPIRPSRSRFLTARGVRYHIREWGPADGPPLVLLHGARDTSASFQFIADELRDAWRIVAPDWRGHGLTGWTPGNYWLSDFLCDLDALMTELFPDRSVPVVGHSMGGNVASAYAGLRPARVSRLVVLDALGNPPDRDPVPMAETLLNVLDGEARDQKIRTYRNQAEMAGKLVHANSRLGPAQAAYLAGSNARLLADGRFGWAWDPTFQRSWPTLHSNDEWGDCWRRIEAPGLCLISSDPAPNARTGDPELILQRARYFRNLTLRTVPDTGHNLHHDAPGLVARAIEAFVRD